MKKIGFIGLGVMGLPMAQQLSKHFEHITVFDVAPSDEARQSSLLRHVQNPGAVGQASDVVFLCLPGAYASLAVLEGLEGLLSVARPGLTVVELSTLDPEVIRDIGNRYAACGAAFCDAPVFGAPVHAREGKLAVVVSGEDAHYEAVRAMIASFARRVTHAGALGSASLIKVMQNSLGLVQIVAIAEAFAVFEAAGGDPHKFHEAVVGCGGMADSPLFAKVGIDFADHQARFGALLRIAAKDIALGDKLAKRSGAPATMIAHAAAQYAAALDEGLGDADQLAFAAAMRHQPKPAA